MRRRHVDLDGGTLTIEVSVGGRRTATRQKDTRTHQMRRVALDAETVEIVREQIARHDDRIRQLGMKTPRDPFLFSLDPDCGAALLPDSVSQRFERLVARLDSDTSLHKLRHYNATELIGAGVDVRTVAGRLGHAGGGATTFRVYAAWVNEADRRAADTVASPLPRRPIRSGIRTVLTALLGRSSPPTRRLRRAEPASSRTGLLERPRTAPDSSHEPAPRRRPTVPMSDRRGGAYRVPKCGLSGEPVRSVLIQS